MARYHGKTAAIYISTSGSTVANKLSSMTDWTLNGQTEKLDATCFEDANIVRKLGLPDRQGSLTGLFDDTESDLFTAAASADGCKLYLYPDVVNLPTKYHYGPALVDFSMKAGVKALVQVDATWVANGNWGHTF